MNKIEKTMHFVTKALKHSWGNYSYQNPDKLNQEDALYLIETALKEKLDRSKGCNTCKPSCDNCGQGNYTYCNKCKGIWDNMSGRENVSFCHYVPLDNYCKECGKKLGE